VERSPSVVVHAPEAVGVINVDGGSPLDFHPDGKRVVVAVHDDSPTTAGRPGRANGRYIVVLNWVNELTNLLKSAAK
jgi:hypothetical protein